MKKSKVSYLSDLTRIVVPTIKGYELIDISEICHLESDNIYTKIQLKSRSTYVLTSLLSLDNILPDRFFRSHKSFLINIENLIKINTKDGLILEMASGKEVPLSRAKKQEFLKKLCLIRN